MSENLGPVSVDPNEVSTKKPYDLNVLIEKIVAHAKADGLDLHFAEEALKKAGKAVYGGAKEWLQESAHESGNKLDDLIVPLFGFADQYVLPQIEKIDFDGKKE